MMAGVSTRDYDGLLDEMSGGLGLKKSLVSEAFVKASRGALDLVNSRDLKSMNICSIMIDGLGLSGLLRIAFLSTNPLESTFSILKPKLSRVKNWRTGPDQISRWAATTLLEAEKKLHAIQGFRELPLLLSALQKFTIAEEKKLA